MVFLRLDFDGKINSAIRYISQDSEGRVQSMDDAPIPGSSRNVWDVLLKISQGNCSTRWRADQKGGSKHQSYRFKRLTQKLMKDVTKPSNGTTGPSGLNSKAWKHMLMNFKQSSNPKEVHSSSAIIFNNVCLIPDTHVSYIPYKLLYWIIQIWYFCKLNKS